MREGIHLKTMRRYVPIIMLAGTLVGLGSYLYFIEIPNERDHMQVDSQEKKLLPFEEHDITGLTVKTSTGPITLSQSGPTGWNITDPVQAEADTREVQSLIRALVLGNVSRTIEEGNTALTPFGLDNPTTSITVRAGAREETVLIGDSGPISSTLYAMRQSDHKVLLTTLEPKDFLNKSVMSFRRKDVLHFSQDQADRLRINYPNAEIVLYRQGASAHGSSSKGTWHLRAPIEAKADQAEVRALLLKLEDLKAIDFIDKGQEHVDLLRNLLEPAIKITIHAGGTDHTLKLYQFEDVSEQVFAVTTPDAPIYRITPLVMNDLTKELFDLQDKRLLGVDYDEIALLKVKTRTHDYTLINEQGAWILEDQPTKKLSQEKADLFVSRVVNLPAEIRVLKQLGPLGPYGLTSPSAEFTAIGKDGKVKGRIVLGNKISGLVYALGQGLPGLFQTRADLLDQVPSTQDLLTLPSSNTKKIP